MVSSSILCVTLLWVTSSQLLRFAWKRKKQMDYTFWSCQSSTHPIHFTGLPVSACVLKSAKWNFHKTTDLTHCCALCSFFVAYLCMNFCILCSNSLWGRNLVLSHIAEHSILSHVWALNENSWKFPDSSGIRLYKAGICFPLGSVRFLLIINRYNLDVNFISSRHYWKQYLQQ